jgi:hypothetical protein
MKHQLPRRAWAILDADGSLATHDGRLPLFWYRTVAERFSAQHVVNGRIVRVTVAQAPRRTKKRVASPPEAP